MASIPTKRLLSAFADSSALFAAAVSATGAARELIARGIRGEIRVFLSEWVLEETQRNLSAKRPSALPALQRLRDDLPEELIDPPKSLVVRVAKVIEPKDAPIVAAAMAAKAQYLATYDRKHLLSQRDTIKAHFGIEVVLPDELLRL